MVSWLVLEEVIFVHVVASCEGGEKEWGILCIGTVLQVSIPIFFKYA